MASGGIVGTSHQDVIRGKIDQGHGQRIALHSKVSNTRDVLPEKTASHKPACFRPRADRDGRYDCEGRNK